MDTEDPMPNDDRMAPTRGSAEAEGNLPGAPPAMPAAEGLRSPRRRMALFLACSALGLAAIIGRLTYLQFTQFEHFSGIRERQTRSVIVREQPRMKIVFRDGDLAAQSIAAESVYVEPHRIADKATAAGRLAWALGRQAGEILPLLDESQQSNPERACRFRWVQRRVAPEAAARIRALCMTGVGLRTEYRRRYPAGRHAAQVLGGVEIDGQGAGGIELAADPVLHGSRESERILRDARMRPIAVSTDLPAGQADGAALVLTLHRGIQHIVEEELDRMEAEHRPAWACAIAMDPASGEVLAMANRPTLDANDFGSATPDARRNRCVTDTYEPGSTFKTFVLAALLDEGLGSLDDVVDCEKGGWTYQGRRITDHHPYGTLSVQDVIAKSSNIGAVKLGLRVIEGHGVAGLRNRIRSFGFGAETGCNLPGESSGRLTSLAQWTSYTSSSVPYGYEVAVTPLQLARAYAVFANGGYLVEPRLVKGVVGADGRAVWSPSHAAPRRVLRPETVERVRRALRAVVESGTGAPARLAGYAVAGKTGTTKLYNPATKHYDGGYIASFTAFAPADAPRLCVLVVIDRPQGKDYYGGKVAAPAVARILDRGLRMLEVPPRLETTARAAGP